METVGQRIDRIRAPAGFDYLRVGLSFAVVIWHSVVSSYGVQAEHFFWVNVRYIPGNILPMFFALSGFLVAGSWERTKSLPLFFGYRAVRLIPALTVEVLLSALLLGPLLTALPIDQYFSGSEFAVYFFNILGIPQYHLPGVFSSNPLPDTVNVTLWTLPFELECYLLLGILGVLGLRGQRKRLLLIAFVLSIVVSTFALRHNVWQEGRPPGRVLVGAFAAGLLIYLYRYRMPISRPLFWASVVLGLALSSRASLALLSLPFVAYCTVYLGVKNPPKRTFLLRGDYSYGLYLFGFPLQQAYCWLFPGFLHWWANAAFAITFGLAYAAVSWRFIEKPLLEKRNEIIGLITAAPRAVFSRVTGR